MTAKARWGVQRFVRQIGENLERNGTFAEQRARAHKKMAGLLRRSATLNALQDLAIDLWSLVSLEGQAGVLLIAQGDNGGGWQELQLSHSYLCARSRIYEGLFRRGHITAGWCAPKLQNELARCLAHAIATGNDQFAVWAGDVLLANYSNGGGLFTRWRSPFEPFMARLYGLWKKRSLSASPLPGPPLGVFQEVLDDWESPKIGAAVEKACQFHAERSVFDRGPFPDFALWPHNVFPAEILAIRRVRREQGLDWPSVQHALLNTAFAAPPFPLPPPKSDLLIRITSKMRSCLPEVTPDDA